MEEVKEAPVSGWGRQLSLYDMALKRGDSVADLLLSARLRSDSVALLEDFLRLPPRWDGSYVLTAPPSAVALMGPLSGGRHPKALIPVEIMFKPEEYCTLLLHEQHENLVNPVGQGVKQRWTRVGASGVVGETFSGFFSQRGEVMNVYLFTKSGVKLNRLPLVYTFLPYAVVPPGVADGEEGIILSEHFFEFNSDLSMQFVADTVDHSLNASGWENVFKKTTSGELATKAQASGKNSERSAGKGKAAEKAGENKGAKPAPGAGKGAQDKKEAPRKGSNRGHNDAGEKKAPGGGGAKEEAAAVAGKAKPQPREGGHQGDAAKKASTKKEEDNKKKPAKKEEGKKGDGSKKKAQKGEEGEAEGEGGGSGGLRHKFKSGSHHFLRSLLEGKEKDKEKDAGRKASKPAVKRRGSSNSPKPAGGEGGGAGGSGAGGAGNDEGGKEDNSNSSSKPGEASEDGEKHESSNSNNELLAGQKKEEEKPDPELEKEAALPPEKKQLSVSSDGGAVVSKALRAGTVSTTPASPAVSPPGVKRASNAVRPVGRASTGQFRIWLRTPSGTLSAAIAAPAPTLPSPRPGASQTDSPAPTPTPATTTTPPTAQPASPRSARGVPKTKAAQGPLVVGTYILVKRGASDWVLDLTPDPDFVKAFMKHWPSSDEKHGGDGAQKGVRGIVFDSRLVFFDKQGRACEWTVDPFMMASSFTAPKPEKRKST